MKTASVTTIPSLTDIRIRITEKAEMSTDPAQEAVSDYWLLGRAPLTVVQDVHNAELCARLKRVEDRVERIRSSLGKSAE